MTSPDWPTQETSFTGRLRELADHIDKNRLNSTVITVGCRVNRNRDVNDLRVQLHPNGTGTHTGLLLAWMSTLADPVVRVVHLDQAGDVHLHLTGALRGEAPVTVTVVVILTDSEAGALAKHMAVQFGALVPVEVLHQVQAMAAAQPPVDGPANRHQAVDQ